MQIGKQKIIFNKLHYFFCSKLNQITKKPFGCVCCLLSSNRKFICKIDLIRHPNKLNSLKKEYKFLDYLNKKNCTSVPKVYEYGILSEKLLKQLIYIIKRKGYYIGNVDNTLQIKKPILTI